MNIDRLTEDRHREIDKTEFYMKNVGRGTKTAMY